LLRVPLEQHIAYIAYLQFIPEQNWASWPVRFS